MKYFSLIPILLFTSLAQSETSYVWDKSIIEELKKNTVYDVFCKNPAGPLTSDLCDHTLKNKNQLNSKVKSIELENAKAIRISSESQSVEISRGTSFNEFVINKKRYLLTASSSPEEIILKISELLPKVAVHSLFFNNAYAEDSFGVEQLTTAVSLLIAQTTDSNICKSGKKIVDMCGDKLEDSIEKSPKGYDLLATIRNLSELNDYRSQVYALNHERAETLVKEMLSELEKTQDFLKKNEASVPKNSCSLTTEDGKKLTTVEALQKCGEKLSQIEGRFTTTQGQIKGLKTLLNSLKRFSNTNRVNRSTEKKKQYPAIN